MPAAVAIPLITAGVTGAASIVGGKMQSGAARDAAKLQTDAANHAADVQAESARQALAFQEQQASYAAATAEVNRHANYDQWAAKEANLGSIGQMLLGSRFKAPTIPGYVPGAPATFSDGAPAAPPVAAIPTTTVNNPYATSRLMPGPAGPVPPPSPKMASIGTLLDPGRAALPFASTMPPPGVVAPPGTPRLNPDGTYAIPPPPPYGSIGSYLGA